MPYDDLPETDELLMELEGTVEDQQSYCPLWQSNSNTFFSEAAAAGPIGHSPFQLDTPQVTSEPMINVPSHIKGL